MNGIFKRVYLMALLVVGLALLAACGGGDAPVLRVGGIPDQDASLLARRYDGFSEYLSQKLGVPVEYVPSADYAAVVTAFGQGNLDLAFFGGLTGVQARIRNPGAQAVAQREQDAQFHSKFIVRSDLPAESLDDLAALSSGLTLTFGSESSTSGHLMPRFFLKEAGIDPDSGFKSPPNYSGSHDLTWRLVESGAFDVGALNEDVWQRAVAESSVDTSKVRVLETTPPYFDYNWTAGAALDEEFGDGFTGRVQAALLELNAQDNSEILELFSTERFIATENANYAAIESVARVLGIIK
ncbi:MAG: putative selenate ABC transporter substrate-binding protein [Chloroflexi bacterium]|nr:putative selenate ABC transporter substrate-binding protein [Chloroflexota bacterium]MDA1270845.1 putative selenate ABC transporter substrate-binding protein [Chloroflexota bacterium]